MGIEEFIQMHGHEVILNAIGKFKCCDHFYLMDKHKPKDAPSGLFITMDGVDIRLGDRYWTMDEKWEIFESVNIGGGCGENTQSKYFSTERAAINYRHENKPIYSIKDFRELINTFEEIIAPKIPT